MWTIFCLYFWRIDLLAMKSLVDNFFFHFEYVVPQPFLHCFWLKSVINIITVSIYMKSRFSLATFKIFHLISHSLAMMCLRVDLFVFILLEVNTEFVDWFFSSNLISFQPLLLKLFFFCLFLRLATYVGVFNDATQIFFLQTLFLLFFSLHNFYEPIFIATLSSGISNVIWNLSNFSFKSL